MDPPPQHCVSSGLFDQEKLNGFYYLRECCYFASLIFSIKCSHRRQFWKLHWLGLQKRDSIHVCFWVKGHGILWLPPSGVPHRPDVCRDNEGGEGHRFRSPEEVQARQEQISIYMTSVELHPHGYLFHHFRLLLRVNILNRYHQEMDWQKPGKQLEWGGFFSRFYMFSA